MSGKKANAKGVEPKQEKVAKVAEQQSQRFYLDRIEDDIAVLLPADDEAAEIEIERSRLPVKAREGDWLSIEAGDDGTPVYRVDREATKSAKSRVQSLMDELS